eukprot:2477629-Prymnesium_polylepis.1
MPVANSAVVKAMQVISDGSRRLPECTIPAHIHESHVADELGMNLVDDGRGEISLMEDYLIIRRPTSQRAREALVALDEEIRIILASHEGENNVRDLRRGLKRRVRAHQCGRHCLGAGRWQRASLIGPDCKAACGEKSCVRHRRRLPVGWGTTP